MSIFSLLFNTGRLPSPIAPAGAGSKLLTAVALRNLAMQLESGMQDNITLAAKVTPLNASGTITLSSSSGVLTATINGVACATGSLAGTDAENATALAAAINASANALVAGIVTASASGAVVTVTSVDKSKTANAITLAASGTGATASGARLTAGSNGTETSYTF